LSDGKVNSDAVIAHYGGSVGTSAPLFGYVKSLNDGAGINGFNDIYIPARDELLLLLLTFTPNTASRTTGTRTNDANCGNDGLAKGHSDYITPPFSGFTATVPPITTSIAHRTGGAQALTVSSAYWSSSMLTSSSVWIYVAGTCQEIGSGVTVDRHSRLVRRVLVS
jgi:hypothetical protein